MANILREVLNIIETAERPVSVNRIARQLAVEPGIVEGMIQHWVRKGKLRQCGGPAESNCQTCGSADGCPFIVNMPLSYELVTQETPVEPVRACPRCH